MEHLPGTERPQVVLLYRQVLLYSTNLFILKNLVESIRTCGTSRKLFGWSLNHRDSFLAGMFLIFSKMYRCNIF